MSLIHFKLVGNLAHINISITQKVTLGLRTLCLPIHDSRTMWGNMSPVVLEHSHSITSGEELGQLAHSGCRVTSLYCQLRYIYHCTGSVSETESISDSLPLGVTVDIWSFPATASQKRRTLSLAVGGWGQRTLRMLRLSLRLATEICQISGAYIALIPWSISLHLVPLVNVRNLNLVWSFSHLASNFTTSVAKGNGEEWRAVQSGKKKVICWMGV